MHTKKTFILLLLWSLGLSLPIKANLRDSSNVFSLEKVLILAKANNTEILKSLAEVKSAKADNQQASAAFLPAIELSNSYMSSNDPLYAFGFKLQQQGVTMADFDPSVINSPGTTNHFNTQVLVEQPLVNIDAWMGKSAANHKVKATELKSEYTKSHISFIIKQTYYALQLAKNRTSVIKKAHEASEAYLKIASENLNQGYLKEADVLAIKVRKLELEAQLKESESKEKSVTEMLNFLMGRDIYLPLVVSDSIEKIPFTYNGIENVNQRADVVAMQYGLESRKLMQKSSALKFAPRINAFGMYNLYDSEFAQFDSQSWMVGLKLQWKIFNGGQNIGKLNKTKAEFTLAELSYNEYLYKSNMELSQAKRDIALRESQLFTYQMATNQAKESLRIRTNRYEEGLERTSDLLMAEAKFAESELKYLNAIYNYNVSVFKYDLLSSKTE
ncbi:TolC family protein [Labilibacter sediminis]|nr:TolC family protein [Labilibacter sediminis]